MHMVKKEADYFREKLDKIYDLSFNNNAELVGIKEHLKTLNGKVATHTEKLTEYEKRFTQVYDDFRTREDLNKNGFDVYKDKIACEITGLKEKIEKGDADLKADMTKDSREQERKIWGVELKVIGLVTVITTLVTAIINFII